jgi:hypothetical protein
MKKIAARLRKTRKIPALIPGAQRVAHCGSADWSLARALRSFTLRHFGITGVNDIGPSSATTLLPA